MHTCRADAVLKQSDRGLLQGQLIAPAREGLIWRSPLQFGQVRWCCVVAQATQKVHSNEQIIASFRSRDNVIPQVSHSCFISSIGIPIPGRSASTVSCVATGQQNDR